MKAALIVIDMQNGFINPASPICIAGAAASVPRCAKLINHCRSCDIPVIFVTREYRSDGSDIEHTRYDAWLHGGKPLSPGCDKSIDISMPQEFGCCERDYHIIKPRFSAFFNTSLDILLRRLCVDTVLLIGTTTPNCIRASCYDAISLDYNTVVVSDCTSSANETIQQANLEDMRRVGAQLISSEEVINGVPLADNVSYIQLAVQESRR